MVERPKDYLERLPLPGGSIFTFHLESKGGVLVMIKKIKQKNWLPSWPFLLIRRFKMYFPFLDKLHQVLIMTVKPGFAGQPMLTDPLSKIDPLLGYRQTRKLKFRIAVDGGVTVQNYEMLLKKGVDDFAIGSGIFKYPDPQKALRILMVLIALRVVSSINNFSIFQGERMSVMTAWQDSWRECLALTSKNWRLLGTAIKKKIAETYHILLNIVVF